MELIEIVEKLTGPIRPIGESNEDERRFINLKQMCNLAEDIVQKISEVGYVFANRQEYSIKKASDYANKFTKETLGIED